MNHLFSAQDPMLSRTAEHALRATIFLARQDHDRPLSVEAIASGIGAPRNYLGKTLGSLANNGIVVSTPGRNGGFRLAVAAEELSVARIADAVDTPRRSRTCLLGGGPCDNEDPCAMHRRWKAVLDLSRSHIEDLMIAHLIAEQSDEAVSTPSSQVGPRKRTHRSKEKNHEQEEPEQEKP
jgi:Rrf2 family protein